MKMHGKIVVIILGGILLAGLAYICMRMIDRGDLAEKHAIQSSTASQPLIQREFISSLPPNPPSKDSSSVSSQAPEHREPGRNDAAERLEKDC